MKLMRFAVMLAAAAGTLAVSTAGAGEMRIDEAKRFIAGKLYSFRCFDGTAGTGRIQHDGSVAVALLAKLAYAVTASTGRPAETPYLKELGAAEVIERKELAGTPRPLAKERWAGGIDTVGSTTLANVLSTTAYGGAVAACGLAGGMDLPTSVAPFILRGVSLLGIDSVMCSQKRRREAWNRLASDLDRGKLAAMTSEIGLGQVSDFGSAILEGRVRGRIVVKIG